jgi:hypothetical protein
MESNHQLMRAMRPMRMNYHLTNALWIAGGVIAITIPMAIVFYDLYQKSLESNKTLHITNMDLGSENITLKDTLAQQGREKENLLQKMADLQREIFIAKNLKNPPGGKLSDITS